MTVTSNVNMFYLGNFADMDIDESNYYSDNASLILGDHGQPDLVTVTENDANCDGKIYDNEHNPNNDTLSYDAGNGPVTVALDSTNQIQADITLGDGSVTTVSVAVLQTENGDVFIRDVGNSLDNLNIQNINLVSVVSTDYSGSYTNNSIENTKMVCFARGTHIATETGETPVEQLKSGDFVLTHDAGPQRITWVGFTEVATLGRRAPILIPKGALGQGLPHRDLRVSRQHRLLLRSAVAERMFGHREILIPACKLLGLNDIHQERTKPVVQYWHILLNKHHVLMAEGAPAESLYLGDQALRSMSPRQIERIPQAQRSRSRRTPLARYVPNARQQRTLVRRHFKNRKPVLTG